VVDRDVALRKSEAIEHHASRLRAKLPLRAAALDADESLLNDVCFALLEKHGIIAPVLSSRLARAAGLRNLIVHRYGDLVAAKLVEAIATGLGDLDNFAAALRAHAGSSGSAPNT